MKMKKRI